MHHSLAIQELLIIGIVKSLHVFEFQTRLYNSRIVHAHLKGQNIGKTLVKTYYYPSV